MAGQLVRVEIAAPIARVTLDDPPMNPISTRTLDALHAALDRVEADRKVGVVILTGAGERAFCAGADLRRSWDSMVAFEEELCAEVFETPDAKEGRHAFLEKRSHAFRISDGQLSHGGVMAFAQVRSRPTRRSSRRIRPLPNGGSGRIEGKIHPPHGRPGHRRRLPVSLAGVSGYHWT